MFWNGWTLASSKLRLAQGFALLSIGLARSALLPNEVCFASSALFRTAGCTGNENAFCAFLAFKLLLDIDGEPLCVERPCTGYGQSDTHSCRGLLECPLTRIELTGICNGLDICCRNG